MANVPGTSGPVAYPNRPEGGAEGGTSTYTPMPGGTNVPPQPASGDVTPQQGAGSGSSGLFPNPGEPASGSVQKGWRGGAYASAAPPVFEAVTQLDVAQTVSGRSGVADTGAGLNGGIEAPSTFKQL